MDFIISLFLLIIYFFIETNASSNRHYFQLYLQMSSMIISYTFIDTDTWHFLISFMQSIVHSLGVGFSERIPYSA